VAPVNLAAFTITQLWETTAYIAKAYSTPLSDQAIKNETNQIA